MADLAPPPSAPPAPPTPPVPLTALLAHDELGLRQIAGPAAAGTDIHWVHTSEMADPYPYLLGGELLLTAGVHVPDTDADTHLDAYVSRIVAAGGAALGFGVAPVHDTVPRALVAACDRHGLPLLEVPPRTTFSGVARAVWQLMAEARHAELRRVAQAQQGLAAAAARPDPVPALLRQLAVRLGGFAALYAADGTAAQTAGTEPGPAARAALERLAGVVRHPAETGGGVRHTAEAGGVVRHPAEPGGGVRHPTEPGRGVRHPAEPGRGVRHSSEFAGAARHPAEPEGRTGPVGRPTPSSATDTVDGTHLAAYALAGAHGLALGVGTRQREPGDHTVAGVAAVLLSLLTAPHQGAAESARSAALVRLLLGAAPQDTAPLLGADHWTVIHARAHRGTHEPGEDRTPPTPASLAAALGSTLMDEHGAGPGAGDGERVVLLLPGDREVAAQRGWVLGVSAPVGVDGLAAADAQADRALRRAEATRAALVRHRETGLAALVAPAEADAHARVLLGPLDGTGPLAETLRTWLSLHGSWDRTAAALSVHRNTVRQRIARCAALLDADLDDPDVRMELWFALSRPEGARGCVSERLRRVGANNPNGAAPEGPPHP
ncbi:PucR family transcriptional regulator ligand-binding domain-containing protein [Streptomyces sp. NPDC059063]|uniref:PucR family transcriptional regulator ligand-binding domain-containing protein n=1 Tax=unclassified Streptomyces TaxID=2593676 RepID=UPI0036845B5A